VINAAGVALTGNKADKKIYYRHTGWFGGLKTEPAKRLVSRKPDDALRLAVKGMLPKGPLGRSMLSKLKVYAGPDHPHQAQAPVALELKV
jgi:large subunit ribosomal protein L13